MTRFISISLGLLTLPENALLDPGGSPRRGLVDALVGLDVYAPRVGNF